MTIYDTKIMKTQINDNLKNNKNPINLIGIKVILKEMITGITFIMKIK